VLVALPEPAVSYFFLGERAKDMRAKGDRHRLSLLGGTLISGLAALGLLAPAADATTSTHANTTVSASAVTSLNGYWLAGGDGAVYNFGSAGYYGSMAGRPLTQPVLDMASTPTNKGYWLVAADGGVFGFGDAKFYSSMGGIRLADSMISIAATPDGHGYWLASHDGGCLLLVTPSSMAR
jgi:hypothetical protein